MRRFLLKILFIGLCVLVPLIIADYAMSKNYQNRDYYPFTTMTDIVEGRLNSDLWILGSSRAWVQYNPTIIDSILDVNSYNLGLNAQFIVPEIQSYTIARLFNSKPKYVLLDLFMNSLTKENNPGSRYFIMPYLYNIKIRRIIGMNDVFNYSYLYIPFYRFHSEKHQDIHYHDNITNKGFLARNWKWIGDDNDKLYTITYCHDTEAIELLNGFLSDCRRDSIIVILIHSPFYHDGFEKIHGNDDMMELFRTIAINNDVPFLDYTNDPISYDTSYFYNNMHLNAQGANLFTTKLAHDLDSLGLIPARK